MLIILITRDDNIHIVDITTLSGKHWTKCGLCFSKQDRITTIAADNTFAGICTDCKIFADMEYQMNLDETPEIARGSFEVTNKSFVSFHRKNYAGPKSKFSKVASHTWRKLGRYRDLPNKKKEHE